MLALSAVSVVTPSEPHYAAAGREAASPGERATTIKFWLWEARGCSASLPQTSCLSSEPGTLLARGQAVLQGRATVTKASLFLLPACCFTPAWCDTYEVESSFHRKPPAIFPRCCIIAAGSGSSPTPFPRHQPRSGAGEPGAIEAGFGRYLLDQVFALILPGPDSHPHLCLLLKSQAHLPPTTPLPQHRGVGSSEKHCAHFIFSLSALFT